MGRSAPRGLQVGRPGRPSRRCCRRSPRSAATPRSTPSGSASGAATTPLNYASCAFDAGKPAPVLLSPAASFASLFGSVASGQAGEEFETRKQLLEFALEDVSRELKTFSGSKRGRAELETYGGPRC